MVELRHTRQAENLRSERSMRVRISLAAPLLDHAHVVEWQTHQLEVLAARKGHGSSTLPVRTTKVVLWKTKVEESSLLATCTAV